MASFLIKINIYMKISVALQTNGRIKRNKRSKGLVFSGKCV